MLGDAERALTELMDLLGRLMRRGAARRTAPTPEAVRAWDTAIQELADRAHALAVDADSERRAKERNDWATWIKSNADSGARNAHRFMQLPTEWQPTTTLTIDGVITADPMRVLESYTTKYRDLWHDDDDDHDFCSNEDGWAARTALPRPDPEEIRAASLLFPERTATAYDGFHPRHYSMLCGEALVALGCMFVVAELVGALPPQLRLLAMPMIPKPSRGHRAVAIFVSFYRVWVRIRKPHIAAWEMQNDRPYLAAGKDRSPQDTVWRQAARAELATAERREAGAVLSDMASFFECLNRRKLRRRLDQLSFPRPVAKLALAAYSGPRVLTMSGALSQPTYAWRGVTAGCGAASALIRAYVVPPLDHLVLDFRLLFDDALDLDMFVDDVVLNATGDNETVEHALYEGQVMLTDVIERELECKIERSKTAIVTSNNRLAKRLVRRLGRPTGGTCASAVNLGVDFAPGRTRTAQRASGRRARRFHGLAKKVRPFKQVCKVLGGKASKIFVAGPLPFAVYGSVVNGMTDSEALKLRRMLALSWSPRARGRSLRMLCLLHRVPTHTAENGAALQYSREVWRSSMLGAARPAKGELTLPEIARIWNAVDKNTVLPPATGKRMWNAARGPIANLWLTLDRIGWGMSGPFTMVDDFGRDIVLTTHSPKMIAHMMHLAAMRTLERQLGEKMTADGYAQFAGRRVCLDHVRTRLKADRSMDASARAVYRSALCGAVMTHNKAARAGYLVEDKCPLCGRHSDTVFNRTWLCTHKDAVEARNRVAPRWTQREAERRGPSDPLFALGLFPNPADEWPKPADDASLHLYRGTLRLGHLMAAGDAHDYQQIARHIEAWQPNDEDLVTSFTATAVDRTELNGRVNGQPSVQLAGRLYVDGSATQNTFTELRRAAAALVVRQPYCDVEAWYLLPVWSPLPQTSQSAEYVAALAPHQHIVGDAVIVSDCQNVVADCARNRKDNTFNRKKYAGLFRHAAVDEARNVTEVVKTRAHRNVSGMQAGTDREDAIGNMAADRAAKEAIKLHPQPTPAQVQELDASCKRAAIVIRTIAAVLSTFPPMPRERMVRRPPCVEGAGVSGVGGHEWRYLHGLWRCHKCLRCTVNQKLGAKEVHSPCKGIRPNMTMANIADKGHDVVYTEGHFPVIFCGRCGAFSWRRSYGLAVRCPRRPTPAGAQALARIKKGLVPWISSKESHLPRRRLGMAGGGVWCPTDRAKRSFQSRDVMDDDGDGEHRNGAPRAVRDRTDLHYDDLDGDGCNRTDANFMSTMPSDAQTDYDVFGHGFGLEGCDDGRDGDGATPSKRRRAQHERTGPHDGGEAGSDGRVRDDADAEDERPPRDDAAGWGPGAPGDERAGHGSDDATAALHRADDEVPRDATDLWESGGHQGDVELFSYSGGHATGDVHPLDDEDDPFGHGGDLNQVEDMERAEVATSDFRPRRATQQGDLAPGSAEEDRGRRRGRLDDAAAVIARTEVEDGAQDEGRNDAYGGPIWTHPPPSWMYLPHLYPPRAVGPAVANRDGEADTGESGTIGSSRGATSDRRPKRRKRWDDEASKHGTEQYGINAAFESHRERVERKRAALGNIDDHAPSAAQRMEALRRRVIEKAREERGFPAACEQVGSTQRCTESARANAASHSGASARVGPGDPSAEGAAVAVDPLRGRAAAAVTLADVAAIPHPPEDYARLAQASRGEAACGPPGGAAAPPDGTELMVVASPGRSSTSPQRNPWTSSGEGPQRGQNRSSPHNRPEQEDLERSQASGSTFGPSKGHPPMQETARRRDGAGAPSVGTLAARGSGAAARSDGGMKQPQGGCHRHHQWGARHDECPPCIAVDATNTHREGEDAEPQHLRHEGHAARGVGSADTVPNSTGQADDFVSREIFSCTPASGTAPLGRPVSEPARADGSALPLVGTRRHSLGYDHRDTERTHEDIRSRRTMNDSALGKETPHESQPNSKVPGPPLRAQGLPPRPGLRCAPRQRGGARDDRDEADLPCHGRVSRDGRPPLHGTRAPNNPAEGTHSNDADLSDLARSTPPSPARVTSPSSPHTGINETCGARGSHRDAARLADRERPQLRQQRARRQLCLSLGGRSASSRTGHISVAADSGGGASGEERDTGHRPRAVPPTLQSPRDGEIRGRSHPPGPRGMQEDRASRRQLVEDLRNSVASFAQPLGRPPGTVPNSGPREGKAGSEGRGSSTSTPRSKRARTACSSRGGEEKAMQRIKGQDLLPGTRSAGNQCLTGSCSRASTEDEKIHFGPVHEGRIHAACRGRAAAGDANSAVEAAARVVAWHTTAPADSPSGGG